jgi:hypothetical protein
MRTQPTALEKFIGTMRGPQSISEVEGRFQGCPAGKAYLESDEARSSTVAHGSSAAEPAMALQQTDSYDL